MRFAKINKINHSEVQHENHVVKEKNKIKCSNRITSVKLIQRNDSEIFRQMMRPDRKLPKKFILQLFAP